LKKEAKTFIRWYFFLLGLVSFIHGPALFGYFEADDVLWVIRDGWADGWHAMTGNWGLGVAYRPITRLSFLLDAKCFGWHAAPWHAENLALHALNATLLAALARRSGARVRDALLIAGLFAALPLDWENVDWISGRTGLLCLAFLLAEALFALRALLQGAAMWPACLCQAGALLCYEPAAIAPLVLLAAAQALPGALPPRRVASNFAALAATTAALWALRTVLLGTVAVATDIAGRWYPLNAAHDVLSLGAHLWRDLGWASCLAAAALLAAGLGDPSRRRRIVWLLAASLALYLPFTPVAGFTERFAYLAGAPAAAALAVAALSWRWGRPALCLLVLLFGLRAHAQAIGFRHAGDVTRRMLAAIAAIPDDGSNLVFVGVPTHDGPYYLLWANFEDAVAAIRPAAGFAATAEWVLRTPDLLRRARTQPTRFYAYDPRGLSFTKLPRDTWLQTHRIPK
jgi:hypothetical protein